MNDEIILHVDNGIAHLIFNRPEALNTMNENFSKLLIQHSSNLLEDKSVRCIILEGKGDNFCAGGDIKMFRGILNLSPNERKAHYKKFLNQVHMAILNLMRTPAPIIARVQGAAAGFGLSFVLAADLAIAAKNAKFTMAYSQIGLSPDGSSTYFLPRMVGLKKAKELAFLGEIFDANEALDMGIVNRVVSLEELDKTVDKLALNLSRSATQAIGQTKLLLNQSLHSNIVTQLEAETDAFSSSAATQDFVEGVTSFLDKRPPIFKGV